MSPGRSFREPGIPDVDIPPSGLFYNLHPTAVDSSFSAAGPPGRPSGNGAGSTEAEPATQRRNRLLDGDTGDATRADPAEPATKRRNRLLDGDTGDETGDATRADPAEPDGRCRLRKHATGPRPTTTLSASRRGPRLLRRPLLSCRGFRPGHGWSCLR